jgi:DNA-binding NarL/FixJ family response regulator
MIHSVLIVDDHEIVRDGLQTLLAEESELVVGLVVDGASAWPWQKPYGRCRFNGPGHARMTGSRPSAGCAAAHPAGCRADQLCRRPARADAIQAGATAISLKDVLKLTCCGDPKRSPGKPTLHPEVQQNLIRQIAAPADGAPHHRLTFRERDILQHIAQAEQ